MPDDVSTNITPNTDSPSPVEGSQTWFSDTSSVSDLLSKFESREALEARLVPSAEASQEEWSAYYDRLGRPGTPAEYKLDLDLGDDLKEFNLSPDEQAKWAESFYSAGLTQTQIDTLLQGYKDLATSQVEVAKQASEAAQAAQKEYLTQLYGDKTDAKINSAKSVVESVLAKKFPDIAEVMLNDESTWNNSIAVPILNYIAELTNPSSVAPVLPGGSAHNPTAPTAANMIYHGRIVPNPSAIK